MKALLLGMIVSAAIGPIVIARSAPQSEWAEHFSLAMIGGTGGMLLCLALYETSNIKRMALDALGNLLTAACFGPAFAWWVGQRLDVSMCPELIIPCSAALGFCGGSLVRAAKPIWFRTWKSWNSAKADSIAGRGDEVEPRRHEGTKKSEKD